MRSPNSTPADPSGIVPIASPTLEDPSGIVPIASPTLEDPIRILGIASPNPRLPVQILLPCLPTSLSAGYPWSMSQYRSDRDAARLRIEALEGELAAREAEISARGASLAERDAEIERLRHQLVLTGIVSSRARPVNAAWATRVVVLAVAAAGATLGAALLALRPAPTVIVQVAPPAPEAAAAPAQPILADPGAVPAQPEPAGEVETPAGPTAATEVAMRKQLEPKVWAGRGSIDEIRMLKAICSHQGDRACRDRAAALLRGGAGKPLVF